MNKNRMVVDILWTGGFDSTFRVLQLSRLDVEVQPYYLSDNRKSEEYELNAISEIIKLIKQNNQTRCTFRPLISMSKSQRIENKEISDAYYRMRQDDFFGSQYEWLAIFALEHKGIELSVHQDDKAISLIYKYGKLKKIENNVLGEYMVVDKEHSSDDLYTIFGNFHFPLVEYTKLDMKKYYMENGYSDVMEKTWFCHTPINGKPCGRCNPCRYTIQEGMIERFSLIAKIRYHISVILDFITSFNK